MKWIDLATEKNSTNLLMNSDEVVGGIRWIGATWVAFDWEARILGKNPSVKQAMQMVEKAFRDRPTKRRILLDVE